MKRAIAVLAVLLLAGCAGWGMIQPNDASSAAVRSVLARQVLQPGGKADAPAAEGMDGRAAQRGYQKFEKSFDEKGAATTSSGTGAASKGNQ